MKILENCKYLVKYNTLKLRKRLEEKALKDHIADLIKQLAEARADLEILKTKEKLGRKLNKQYKEKIEELRRK